MKHPFEVLGLPYSADADEVRSAYRKRVKQIHPDQFTDPDQKKAAMAEMVELNLAYEEAMRLALPRQHAAFRQSLPASEAVRLAEKMLERGTPESALRQLNRTGEHDAAWYFIQGRALMMLERYNEAHVAFREAVRRDPDNNDYHAGALDAAMSMKREATLQGKLHRLIRNIRNNSKK
ncbi:MAG: J domain-containing protein [Clostridia bacterium]|nr:J domain-containing protein [Clostridia bacterium]